MFPDQLHSKTFHVTIFLHVKMLKQELSAVHNFYRIFVSYYFKIYVYKIYLRTLKYYLTYPALALSSHEYKIK